MTIVSLEAMPSFSGSVLLAANRLCGSAPFICIRQVSRYHSLVSRGRALSVQRRLFDDQRTLNRSIILLKDSRKSYSARSGDTLGRATFSTVSFRYAQSAPAVDETRLSQSGNVALKNENVDDLERLTVKELKDLLSSRSLKTSGIKSELIARLRSSTAKDNAVVNSNTSDSIAPQVASNSTVESSTDPSLCISTEAEAVRSSESVEINSVSGAPSDFQHTVHHASRVDFVPDASIESGHSEPVPTEPSLEAPQMPVDHERPTIPDSEHSTTFECHTISLDQLEREVSLATADNKLSMAELSSLRLLPAIAPSSTVTSHEPVEPQQTVVEVSTDIPKPLERIPYRSPNAIHRRLREIEESTMRLRSSANKLSLLHKEGQPLPLPTQPETPSVFEKTDIPLDSKGMIFRRSMSLAKLFFSKAFQKGIEAGPKATRNMQLVEFNKVAIMKLKDIYLKHISGAAEQGTILHETDFEQTWNLALDEFLRLGSGKFYLMAPARLRQPQELVEGSAPVIKNISTNAETQALPSQDEKRKSREAIISRSFVTRGNREIVHRLAAQPFEIEIATTDAARRKFLERPDLEHTLGPFRTDNSPFCQMFNSMWVRMGLMDRIYSIRELGETTKFSVTFHSFDAAAAFVNRPDLHWLDDQMVYPVYALWREMEQPSDANEVIVSIPRATLEVWRQEAIRRDAPLSFHGLPVIEWEKSMWSVLKRMNLTVGRYGECRRYTIYVEYPHRVLLQLFFKDSESMKRFLDLKNEHYLTNPWKDRFFAMGRIHDG